jgi:hypothetical protein
VPAQAHSWENGENDRVRFSITDADGYQKTWELSGVDRASRALCRPILSCGLVVALIVVPIVAILAHGAMLDRVICGVAGLVVAGLVGLGAQVKRKLGSRRRQRRSRALAGDADRG